MKILDALQRFRLRTQGWKLDAPVKNGVGISASAGRHVLLDKPTAEI